MVADAGPLEAGAVALVAELVHQPGARPVGRVVEGRRVGLGAVGAVPREAPDHELGSRGQQGLIHLDQGFCAPRRCFECPVALRVLELERDK